MSVDLSKNQVVKGEDMKKGKTNGEKAEKLYTIVEVGWEYNDEYYSRGNSRGGVPLTAFRSKAKAEATLREMNDKKILENVKSDYPMTTDGYRPIKDFFELVEVELALD